MRRLAYFISGDPNAARRRVYLAVRDCFEKAAPQTDPRFSGGNNSAHCSYPVDERSFDQT